MASPQELDQEAVALGVRLAEHLVGGNTLASLLGISEESQEALYALGYNLYNQGRYDDAMHTFGFLLLHNHRDRRFYKGFGSCLQMQKRYQDALKYYGIASIMDLNDPVPVFHSAECLLAMSKVDEAIEALHFVQQTTKAVEAHAELAARVEGILQLLVDGHSKDLHKTVEEHAAASRTDTDTPAKEITHE
ncbi:MAG: CesD/SycD/LcrH family type secretion system chaperone [Herminiimonas sp.]|nr:CesD/SycD/LcrH family type secretion system chaperone [Herminiimonas sp.]